MFSFFSKNLPGDAAMQMPLETVLGEEGYCIQHKERRLFFSGVNILTRTRGEIGYLAYRAGFS